MTDTAPQPPTPPTALPEARGDVLVSDVQAMANIHRILNRPGDWSPDTLEEIRDVVLATGRLLLQAADIQVEVLEDARGWPIAHLQSDGLVAYIRQAPDGGLCFDIHTQDDPASRQLRFLVDGNLLHGPALDVAAPTVGASSSERPNCEGAAQPSKDSR